MKRLLAAAGLLALTAATSAYGGSHSGTRTVSSSRLVQGGNIRITVSIDTPVQAGHALRVTYRVRNVSKQPRKIELDYPTSLWLVVRSSDGMTYDTRRAFLLSGSLGGPPRFSTRLRPGATATRSLSNLRVRWSGPLRVTAGWNRMPLPPLRVDVATPSGPPPSDQAAIDDVVAHTGGLLDRCHPDASGVAVTGEIDAPKNSAPPMQASCSISLQRERGFIVAQVLIATPPGYREIQLRPPYELFTWPKTGKAGGLQNAEAIGWLFVVTSRRAISVDSTSMETSKPGKPMAPDWQWTTSGFEGQPGGSKCGGTGGGGGGYTGPLVEFVSVCPS